LEKKIHKIKEEFISKLKIANNIKDIEKLRIEYLGRKGALTLLLRMLGTLSSEERPKIGQLLNQAKREQKKIKDYMKKLLILPYQVEALIEGTYTPLL